jgi:hypothetical protein
MSKKISIIGYGAITYHFGNGNYYKKDDAQQRKIMEYITFLAKAYMPIFVVES